MWGGAVSLARWHADGGRVEVVVMRLYGGWGVGMWEARACRGVGGCDGRMLDGARVWEVHGWHVGLCLPGESIGTRLASSLARRQCTSFRYNSEICMIPTR